MVKNKTINQLREQDWITTNYDLIIQWAKNITKSDELSYELAHYGIEKLLTHKRYEEILAKHNADPKFGHLRAFLLAIMRNSWIGSKSEFSRIHKAHRADVGHRKRIITDEHFDRLTNQPDQPYDEDIDFQTEAIVGILEEMELDVEGRLWYNAKLFQMYLETPNFSELSRRTDIPRMSIANAVEECRQYVKEQMIKRKII